MKWIWLSTLLVVISFGANPGYAQTTPDDPCAIRAKGMKRICNGEYMFNGVLNEKPWYGGFYCALNELVALSPRFCGGRTYGNFPDASAANRELIKWFFALPPEEKAQPPHVMRDILRRRFISDVFGTSKVNSGGASTHSSSATVGAPTNRNNDKLSRKPKQPNDQSGRILDRDGNRCIQKKDDTRPSGSFVQMWFVNTCSATILLKGIKATGGPTYATCMPGSRCSLLCDEAKGECGSVAVTEELAK